MKKVQISPLSSSFEQTTAILRWRKIEITLADANYYERKAEISVSFSKSPIFSRHFWSKFGLCVSQSAHSYPERRQRQPVSAGRQVRLQQRDGGAGADAVGAHPRLGCDRRVLPRGLRLRRGDRLSTGHRTSARPLPAGQRVGLQHALAGHRRRFPRRQELVHRYGKILCFRNFTSFDRKTQETPALCTPQLRIK